MPSENTIYLAALIVISAVLGYLYLKFVVQDEEDLQEIQDIKNTYLFDYNIYLMPCGGTSEMLANTKLNIAELAMERGWKYSPRLHVDLFGNRW